jgi:hypothetical protein
VTRLPFTSDLLGGGKFALVRLLLGEDNNVTEFPVKFSLQLGEILLWDRDQAALL